MRINAVLAKRFVILAIVSSWLAFCVRGRNKLCRQKRNLRSRVSRFPAGSTVASHSIPPARTIIRTSVASLTIASNEPLLNQAVINFERALAPQPGEFDWGFKLQLMYGSDARFIHSLGLFSGTTGYLDRPTGPDRSVSQPSLSHYQRGWPRLEAWQVRHPGGSGNNRSAHKFLLLAHLHF